ncbi:RluA family pseudouridine synthase [Oribacterium sp. P6A1]|uniref:RluA family pseudouridine synthase n=1 Tax=Oribacterium sp. P6A1 TaxID=1410612 RepID=UPI000566AAD0|nr:RluA family pseudouridine synthase [Oribacterium sp. P6A1]
MSKNLRVITYIIPESFRGKTVEAFLRSEGFSKNVIYHLRNTGTVVQPADIDGLLLNDRKTWLRQTLEEGDVLRCNILETEDSPNVTESEIPLSIVYEDQDLMVINKPSDMPIHPSIGHHENTLANALSWYTHHKLGFDTYVNRVINRLDKNTSGLLISAKNMLSAAKLGDMVRERSVHREYLAICQGDAGDLMPMYPAVTEGFDITISAPIARKEESVVERIVDFDRGDDAVTHVKVLSYDSEKDLSLLRIKLETGRTHQIRVHMKYAGHPLTGDFLYNPDFEFMERQALHSYKLEFNHPITGEKLSFAASLPEDMRRLFPGFII